MRRNLPYYLQHGVLALAFAKAEKSQWHWALRIWGVRAYSECSAVFILMCAHECMWPPVPLYECAAQITGWIAYYSAALVHFINCSFEMSPEFKARKKEWVSERWRKGLNEFANTSCTLMAVTLKVQPKILTSFLFGWVAKFSSRVWSSFNYFIIMVWTIIKTIGKFHHWSAHPSFVLGPVLWCS